MRALTHCAAEVSKGQTGVSARKPQYRIIFEHQMPNKREIFFHEDDYCQQQLLPREAAGYSEAELKAIDDFANSHRAPGGMAWTAIYMRKSAPVEFNALKLLKEDFAAIVAKYLPAYDVVYTGYSSHRELCKRTSAWGTSPQCAVFADWHDDGMVANVWTEFFDRSDYVCEAQEETFASMLRSKLESIAGNS